MTHVLGFPFFRCDFLSKQNVLFMLLLFYAYEKGKCILQDKNHKFCMFLQLHKNVKNMKKVSFKIWGHLKDIKCVTGATVKCVKSIKGKYSIYRKKNLFKHSNKLKV